MTNHRLSLVTAFLMILVLFILGRTEFAIGLTKPPFDLVMHAGFFGFLTLLIWYGSVYKARLTFVLVSVLTIADELYQLSIPGRHGSVKDVLAGMTGALIILIFLSMIKKTS
jgi:VanZ like family